MKQDFKSGFVAIVGRANVGKSTLLNYVMGCKLAGVSAKPQTTRGCVRGILNRKEGQVVFVDTPGIHKPHDLLGKWMNHEAEKNLNDADLICWIVLPETPRLEEEKILKVIQDSKTPAILVINQVDRFEKESILPIIDYYSKQHEFKEIIPISARTGDQVKILVQKIYEYLPAGEPLFDPDLITDQNERYLAAEIIREKLYLRTGAEIPYAATVDITSFAEESKNFVRIEATILVEKDSQKPIVVGKRATRIKEIGKEARLDLEKLLGKKVYLGLWVKVASDWKRDQATLKRLGYN